MSEIALLVIDMQKEYFDGESPLCVPDRESVLENVEKLLDSARDSSVEIIHVRHVSADPDDSTFCAGSENVEIKDEIDVREGGKL